MKKLIYLILLIAPFASRAQVIDTAFKAYPSCKTTAFLNNPRTDVLNVGRVEITGCSIDFATKQMGVNYAFCTTDGTTIYSGYTILDGISFSTLLTGSKNFKYLVFQYLGTKLNITYL